MFLILTQAPDARRDPAARRLASALEGQGRVFVVSVHPRCEEFPGERQSLSHLLGRLAQAHPPRLVFALDPEAARVILAHKFLRSSAWVLCLKNDELGGELREQAFHARELWLDGPRTALPRELRRRAFAAPQNGGLTPRLAALLKNPSPRAERYPLTSLIIPVFNAPELLRRCVESLRRHTTPPYELILVDNGSNAATRRALRGFRGARLISNPKNLGFARAVNQGMRKAQGRYLAWINSDTAFGPEWLERLLDCLQSDPAIAAAGPMTNRTVGSQLVKAGTLSWRTLDRFATAWALKHSGLYEEVHRLTGFCLVLKRRAVEAVGLLDERFGPGTYEDYDYCLRLRQAGFKLAAAKDVFVYHREHASFGSTGDFDRRCAGNRTLFVEKWCRRSLEFLDQLDPELSHAPRAL